MSPSDERHEPFSGRFWGIFNVEDEDPEPFAMFRSREDATSELSRRQGLDPENDDHLTEYHQVFRVDLLGVWWNSYDADPHEKSKLMPETTIELWRGQDNA